MLLLAAASRNRRRPPRHRRQPPSPLSSSPAPPPPSRRREGARPFSFPPSSTCSSGTRCGCPAPAQHTRHAAAVGESNPQPGILAPLGLNASSAHHAPAACAARLLPGARGGGREHHRRELEPRLPEVELELLDVLHRVRALARADLALLVDLREDLRARGGRKGVGGGAQRRGLNTTGGLGYAGRFGGGPRTIEKGTPFSPSQSATSRSAACGGMLPSTAAGKRRGNRVCSPGNRACLNRVPGGQMGRCGAPECGQCRGGAPRSMTLTSDSRLRKYSWVNFAHCFVVSPVR